MEFLVFGALLSVGFVLVLLYVEVIIHLTIKLLKR